MAKILIVYYSGTGNTKAMAEAVADGARSAGATVTLKTTDEATAQELLDCDAASFGSPNYYSYMAGELKGFFDRVYHDVRGNVSDKPYFAFCSSGSRSSQALDSIDRVASLSSLRMRKAFDSILVAGKPSAGDLSQCREMGSKLAQI